MFVCLYNDDEPRVRLGNLLDHRSTTVDIKIDPIPLNKITLPVIKIKIIL